MNRIISRQICFVFFLYLSNLISQTTDDAIRIMNNHLGFGARALGMGGAYSAVADDYSAIYWNPAGLAQMRKMEFWFELSHVNFNNNVIYRGNSSVASNNATKFNSFGLVFPVPTYRGSLVFALGYQRLKDFEYANFFSGVSNLPLENGLSLPVHPTNPDTLIAFYGKDVEKMEFITDDGTVNQWSVAGGIDVSPDISLGLTLNYWTGSSDYLVEFTQTDVFNNFNNYLDDDFYQYQEDSQLLVEYSSFNIKLSGLYRANRNLRFALGMDLPQTFNVNEELFIQSTVDFDSAGIVYAYIDFEDIEEPREYDVKIPFRFWGGISLALGPLLLTGSAEYMDWSQIKFDDSFLLDENKNFKIDYQETIKWRMGSEFGLPFFNSQFRAGYIYEPNPLKEASHNNDRKSLTLGYGVLLDRIIKIDLAYIRSTWEQKTFDDLTPAGTQEDITLQKFIINFAYRF